MEEIFNKIKNSLLSLDPVNFCENYLTIDGNQFKFTGNGYKPFADIYRYVGIKALEKDSKPLIITAGRQVGKTTLATALEMYFMGSGLFGTGGRPPARVMHLFPILEQAAAFSKTKLSSIMAGSKINGNKRGSKPLMMELIEDGSASNSVSFKQFKHDNHLWIESPGENGDRLRGRTADIIFFDEVQDMLPESISGTLKILTKAQYGPEGKGVQVYFGTPKSKSSLYYDMWQESDQHYYHLGCERCEKTFPLYTPGSNEWESIWLYDKIVKCIHCGHEQDKIKAADRGKWIPSVKNKECKLVGFHINQLYIPEFTKERILSEKPGVHIQNTERVYQNEVLGEFFSGETGIISPEDVKLYCSDPGRKMSKEIDIIDGPVFMGIDWGLKADIEQLSDKVRTKTIGQSFSAVTIIQAIGKNKLELVYAYRLKRNDFNSKKEIISELMSRYNVTLAIGDIGFGQDICQILQEELGDKFLASLSSPKIGGKLKFNQEVFPKQIAFEKDYMLAEIFEQLKKGVFRFPYGDYEKIAWLIQHITSMELKPSLSRAGDISPHYVKGSGPNDGLMSLLNAYIAYKFFISNGFKNKNPKDQINVNDVITTTRPPVALVAKIKL